jgi:hypothetical protein
VSEFIAEAQVLIRPNTAEFAATLKAQLEAAVAAAGPVVVPVTAVAAGGGVAAQRAVAGATLEATDAQRAQNQLLARGAVLLNAHAISAETDASAQRIAGAESVRATGATKALQRQQLLAANTAAKYAFAQQEIAGAASEVSAAQVTLTRSTAAVVAAQKAVTAALATNNVAVIDAASQDLKLASAQAVEAETALAAARAQAEHSASLSQLGRGAGATGLTFLGLRGATLAASAAFLAGAAGVKIAAVSIGAASDRTEQLNKSVEVFADSAPAIQRWAETTATSLGISETAALSASSTYGELFRTLGVGPKQAAELSKSLVDLAADLASFNNVGTDRALQAIQSGLVGQARPLRNLGVFLTAARVKEEALNETGKKLASQLTQQDIILARNTLIFKDAAIQIGDVDRTSGRLANQSRFLSAQMTDLAASIGSKLTPVLTDVVITSNAALIGLKKLGGVSPVPGGPDVKNLFGWVTGWHELGILWDHSIFPGLFKMDKEVSVLDGIIKNTTLTINGLRAAFENLGDKVKAPTAGQKSDLALALSQATGNESQELALLQQKQAKQNAFLNRLLSQPQTAKRVALEKKAADNLRQTNQQIQQILDGRAADAKRAAEDQKRAREKAAQAQQEATQAFIDSFAAGQQRLANQLTTAQTSGNAEQQIAINKLIVAADKDEINAIKARIRHLKLHGDALKIAKAEITQLIQDIFNTRNAIAQLREDRRQTLVAARQAHLEALLSIAETTASTRDDVVTEKALIALDRAQIRRILSIKKQRKLTLEEAAQLDSYRVDLAQRNKALRELTKTTKDTSKAQFEFLQTQAGFAANLLGNLIPLGATSGLVGGSTGTTSTATFPTVKTTAQKSVQDSVQKSSALPSGPSLSGQARQTHLLNQILLALLNIYRGTGHPEAHHRRRTNPSAMDLDNHH